MNKFFRLKGKVQHYAWGGNVFINELLGEKNDENQPVAELWLGAHPKGPSELLIGEKWTSLADRIDLDPEQMLGAEIAKQFDNKLPFLFKVLDVKNMLSIQLHPSKTKAETGYAKEETAGVPRLAPYRNYKDQNHKPEFMLALSDFWLLHGFKSHEAIRETLTQVPGWEKLESIFEQQGVKGIYEHVMAASQKEINDLLMPLYKNLLTKELDNKYLPSYWAKKAFEDYTKNGDFDRGIFSIYWFNLLHLEKGEGLFQGAGIPHAYLEGQNMELMANSDNVLRGGLTPKHIDLTELLDNIVYDAVIPNALHGKPQGERKTFTTPVPDFEFSILELGAAESTTINHVKPTIYIVYKGTITIDQADSFKKGEAVYCCPGVNSSMLNAGNERAVLYCASLP